MSAYHVLVLPYCFWIILYMYHLILYVYYYNKANHQTFLHHWTDLSTLSSILKTLLELFNILTQTWEGSYAANWFQVNNEQSYWVISWNQYWLQIVDILIQCMSPPSCHHFILLFFIVHHSLHFVVKAERWTGLNLLASREVGL